MTGRLSVRANPARTDTLALILAGGSGTRLCGLTASRAKPAVPFGGYYRTIDFTLSNCFNSGIRRIVLLTQYKSQSLIRHIHQGWQLFRSERGELLDAWPAQQRCRKGRYAGTADAVYQNRDLIAALNPEHVLVLAGDHIYAMDYARMLDDHQANRADLTLACVEVPLGEANAYGIVEADDSRRLRAFVEKPEKPIAVPGRPSVAYASMGVYLFSREFLFECLHTDAADTGSVHDFGYSIVPRAIREARVYAHAFCDSSNGKPRYWRDVGTVDRYWDAHMDLLRDPPGLDLFDEQWPIRTYQPPGRPARISGAGQVRASIVGRGCRIAGEVSESVLSENCRTGPSSEVRRSVLLPNVRVGRSCWLDRVIIDSNCTVPDNTVITPSELPFDASYHVSPGGVVLVDADALAQARPGRRSAEVA